MASGNPHSSMVNVVGVGGRSVVSVWVDALLGVDSALLLPEDGLNVVNTVYVTKKLFFWLTDHT